MTVKEKNTVWMLIDPNPSLLIDDMGRPTGVASESIISWHRSRPAAARAQGRMHQDGIPCDVSPARIGQIL